MTRVAAFFLFAAMLAWPVTGQEEPDPESRPKQMRREKDRPPRIPDGPFVPKRGMLKRERGEFWAGPPDEGRFAQILLLTLVPREQLQDRLAE